MLASQGRYRCRPADSFLMPQLWPKAGDCRGQMESHASLAAEVSVGFPRVPKSNTVELSTDSTSKRPTSCERMITLSQIVGERGLQALLNSTVLSLNHAK